MRVLLDSAALEVEFAVLVQELQIRALHLPVLQGSASARTQERYLDHRSLAALLLLWCRRILTRHVEEWPRKLGRGPLRKAGGQALRGRKERHHPCDQHGKLSRTRVLSRLEPRESPCVQRSLDESMNFGKLFVVSTV